MRTILLLALLCPTLCFAQANEDTKITVVASDITDLQNKVKYALVNYDFIVKDNGIKDTLTTYPRELANIPGFMIVRAFINNSNVTFEGSYGLTRIDDWGYTNTPKAYQQITYYKGSKTWKLLSLIASRIGNSFTYSK